MANFNLADYETVDSRIKRFYADHADAAIRTELVEYSGEVGKTRWIVRAEVFRDRTFPAADATGYAFENDGEGMANRTSALENCETSAIGRALANLGYSGDRRASREEMTKATETAAPAKVGTPPTDWRKTLEAVKDLDGLQALYDDSAHNWYTDEVKLAFRARKAALQA